MFVEVIRMHMDQLANNNTGWLAGLRDPLVGRVLTLPSHSWMLEELASEAAASRSALADRFTQIVGLANAYGALLLRLRSAGPHAPKPPRS